MATQSQSKSASTLLIFLLILITFPFWIGFLGLAIGTVATVFGSVFGTIFGTIGHVLGAFFGIITWPIRALFGHGFPHINSYTVVCILIVVILISKAKKNK